VAQPGEAPPDTKAPEWTTTALKYATLALDSARMKLLAFADIHGSYARASEILKAVGPVDLVVLAGDLTTNGTPADVAQALEEWRPLAPAWVAVAGNMDSPAIDTELEQLGVSINGHGRRFGDVGFFGCSAAPISIQTPYEIPEAEIQRRLGRGQAEVADAPVQVMVPHAPPHRVVDRTYGGIHAGSTAVRESIERHRPALVLCGHIHEARGQGQLGESLVVNCGPAVRGHYVLVDIDPGRCAVEMR